MTEQEKAKALEAFLRAYPKVAETLAGRVETLKKKDQPDITPGEVLEATFRKLARAWASTDLTVDFEDYLLTLGLRKATAQSYAQGIRTALNRHNTIDHWLESTDNKQTQSVRRTMARRWAQFCSEIGHTDTDSSAPDNTAA